MIKFILLATLIFAPFQPANAQALHGRKEAGRASAAKELKEVNKELQALKVRRSQVNHPAEIKALDEEIRALVLRRAQLMR